MNETTKTLALLTDEELSFLTGDGIDIGCGMNPLNATVTRFDIEDGDANNILTYINTTFDFVYSSHCLEHMNDPLKCLTDWWTLVKPGGHMFIIVPDEDLYEQGIFPSQFNSDHKHTFTISKQCSWSPVSINLLDIPQKLSNATLVSLRLQDYQYNRSLQRHGFQKPSMVIRLIAKFNRIICRLFHFKSKLSSQLLQPYRRFDQTLESETVAQILLILRKNA